jgi:hypothetical protein
MGEIYAFAMAFVYGVTMPFMWPYWALAMIFVDTPKTTGLIVGVQVGGALGVLIWTFILATLLPLGKKKDKKDSEDLEEYREA